MDDAANNGNEQPLRRARASLSAGMVEWSPTVPLMGLPSAWMITPGSPT